MAERSTSPQDFFRELTRRRVFRVAAVYTVAGWAVIEASDTISPLLQLPQWTPVLVLVLVLLAAPVVLALAWAFDFTSQGIQRTASESAPVPESSVRTTAGGHADRALPGDAEPARSRAGSPAAGTRERWWPTFAVTFVLLAAVAGTIAVRERHSRTASQVVRVAVAWPEGDGPSLHAAFALSPDGTRFVHVGPDRTLWLRELDELQPRRLSGTAGASEPFFSPDGSHVGFFTSAPWSLRVASVDGGTVRTLVRDSVDRSGGAWGEDGNIYFSMPAAGIARVRETGGPVEVVSRVDTAHGDRSHAWIDLLPGGKYAVVAIWRGSGAASQVGLLNLETGRVESLFAGMQPRFAWSGHLVYAHANGTVEAVPFNVRRLAVTGPPRTVLENVHTNLYSGGARFALSRNGTLAFQTQTSAPRQELVWVDSTGAATPAAPGWEADFFSLDLSPDGRRVAVTLDAGDRQDVWVKSLTEGSLLRLTFPDQGSVNYRPRWTPDGRSLTFLSDRSGTSQLWIQPSDGSAPARLLVSDGPLIDEGFLSHDGQWAVYRKGGNFVNSRDIRSVRLAADSAPRELAGSPLDEYSPALSPDGRWLAYVSDESGRPEVYVRPFPESGDALWVVSVNGGRGPLWSQDGRRLFYQSERGELMTVDVRSGSTFDCSAPRALFDASSYSVNPWSTSYGLSPDDQRFLMVRPLVEGDASVILILNWFEELP